MWFKNLQIYRLTAPFALAPEQLDEKLAAKAFQPGSSVEMQRMGWMSPRDNGTLVHAVGGQMLITLRTEKKLLPATVINQVAKARAQEIEEKQGYKPGRKEMRELKDSVTNELLPRAFVKSSRTDAFLDLQHGYAAVDTSSRRTGENVMSDIRGMLGSFPAMPLNAEVAPRAILTAWIAGEPLPEGLSLGEECEMKDPAEGGAVVKCQHQELRCDEIDKHLDAGKQVTKLALVFEDNLSFVLGDDLIVRKLKFLDGALDQLEHIDEEGRRAELDARFALQSGEIRRLFLLLEQAFKLSKADS